MVILVEEAWPAVLTTNLSLLTVRLDPLTAKPLVAVAFWREVAPMTVRPELAVSKPLMVATPCVVRVFNDEAPETVRLVELAAPDV